MIYWVIISDTGGEPIHRRPYESSDAAEEYAAMAKGISEGWTVEIRPLPRGEFPW